MKKKKISIETYNEIMSNIIKIGKPVSDTLIDMLEAAGKYTLPKAIKRAKKKQKK